MKAGETDQRYGDAEAQRRFEIIARATLSTPPEPRKAVAGKGRTLNRETAAAGVPQPAEGKGRP